MTGPLAGRPHGPAPAAAPAAGQRAAITALAQACPDLAAPPEGFEEPWQAKVLALTVALHEHGAMTWPQWAQALGARLRDPRFAGEGHGPYYRAWAQALADVLDRGGHADAAAIDAVERRWHEAAARTPHGRPIELDS